MGVAERFEQVQAEVQEVCRRCGRDPESVRIIAVSKTVGPEAVASAIAAGALEFGENRPEGLDEKAEQFPNALWHFIGNIQSRRIPEIVANANLIHSVVNERHGRKIAEAASRAGVVQDILIEVNVSGEASKSGVSPQDALSLVTACNSYEGVSVRGLMTMAPAGDPLRAEETFAGLRELFETIKASLDEEQAQKFSELSMGMSEDWPLAIEQGATMVRIGRAIFSDHFEES